MNRPAKLWQRVTAELVDLIIAGLVFTTGLIFLGAAVGEKHTNGIFGILFLLALTLVIFIIPAWTVRRAGAGAGQTWGKQLIGVRTIRKNGRAFGWKQALVRETLCKGLLIVVGLPLLCIPILIDIIPAMRRADRRMIHDRWCRTQVVQVEGDFSPFGGFFNWN